MNVSYIFEHTILGFCWWDLPALIILLAVLIFYVVKRRDMKKEEKELQDQLAEITAADNAEQENWKQ